MDIAEKQRLIAAARHKAWLLYDGAATPHRSCGITLAETFNQPTSPYQSLRRGGITGHGECGAIVAGRLVLGQFFGDPDPTGPVTDTLKTAMLEYDRLWKARIDRRNAPGVDIICNTLTGQFKTFRSDERHGFWTGLATEVATSIAEVILNNGGVFEVTPIEGLDDFDPANPAPPA